MDSVEMDRLLTLAEIAIAMAGFSSIVVLFKRRDSGTWLASDADRFNGMIIHSVAAAGLCLLPAALGVFVQADASLWRIASAVMGIQVLAHGAVIVFLASTGPASVVVAAGGCVLVALLQGMNVFGWVFDAEAGPFVLGVIWHLVHAGVLFTWLVLVREPAIERPGR